MKKALSLALVCLMAFSLIGCGKKESTQIMYKDVDFSKAIKLADYKNLTVDTTSKEFESFYNNVISSDIENNQLRTKKTEGAIQEGDIANIDYVGKKDGVAFEGGTAQGYDLEIGSNSFIDGFEEGLVGVEIGETVDLNLTFPTNYHAAELAGQKVVFTVTVNSAQTVQGVGPEQIYEELGYDSLKDYEKYVKESAIENYLYNEIVEKSKINDYPDKDTEYLQERIIEMFKDELTSYNMTLESYMSQNGMTEADFKKSVLESDVYPLMDEVMPLYAILDKEKIEISKEDVDEKINEIVAMQGNSSVTVQQLKDYYGEFYFESVVARELALEVVKEQVTIK